LDKGEKIIQETRTFDAHAGITHSMRVKESMNDYRYFPEPDLAPLAISQDWINQVKKQMPILPWEQERILINQFQLPAYDAHLLADSREMVEYFLAASTTTKAYKSLSNWMMGPVKSHLNEKNLSILAFEITAIKLAEIVNLVEEGVISHNLASHQLFPICLVDSSKSPKQIVDEQGWSASQGTDQLDQFIQESIAAYPDKVKEYHKGKKGLIALFIGEVMKKSKGTADPKKVNALMIEALNQLK
jgi:aspartyl-tRNA(Asn)/glutamyl-tRNA(Gln) amidotransferase subunit B